MTDPRLLSPQRKTRALLVLVIALVLEIVDMTIVNTALPAIKAGIGAGATASQWIVAGYALAFALLLMAGGRMGDSLGYRRMFVWGVGAFTLASLLCGLAASPEQLVAARLMQGAAGAIMAPQAMALIQVLFDPLERISRMALFGIVGGLASVAGPILGGLLIDADLFGLGWRIVFLINLPVGLAAVVLGRMLLPEARSSRPAGHDAPGTALFGAAITLLVWPLMQAERGGTGVETLAFAAAALTLGALGWRHVTRRTRAAQPALFDPSLFAIATFRTGLALAMAFAAAGAGFLLVFAFALQAERGQTPLVTGLLHVPYGLGAMLGIGGVGRRFLPRYGKWVPATGASLMTAAVLLVLGGIGTWNWPLPTLVPALLLAGTGMGMTTGCIGPIVVADVDRDHAGAASALLRTGQQLGSALGIAIVGMGYFAAGGWGGAPPSLMAAMVVAVLLAGCVLAAVALPRGIFTARRATQVAAAEAG